MRTVCRIKIRTIYPPHSTFAASSEFGNKIVTFVESFVSVYFIFGL